VTKRRMKRQPSALKRRMTRAELHPRPGPVGTVMERVSTEKKTGHIIVAFSKSWITGARQRAILGWKRDIRICSNPPSDVASCAAESGSREGKRRIN
jgi:L-aminopeptidase/D-esterase-like protein